MSNIADNIESLPFYDYVVDKWNEYAGEKFQTKDPFVEELPDGKTRKLRLPSYCSKQDQKTFKKIQRRAWLDDRCFLGCYPIDCGVGLAPLVAFIPVVGPILMYAVHSRLIHMADHEYHLGAKTVAKLEANIFFDLIISIPPIIGSFFAFLHACSTRNAAIIYNTVSKRAYEAHEHLNTQETMMSDQSPQPQQQKQKTKQQGPKYYEQQAPQAAGRFGKIFDNFDNVKANENKSRQQGTQTKGVYK